MNYAIYDFWTCMNKNIEVLGLFYKSYANAHEIFS